MRLSTDDYYLEILKLVAARSTCGRRSVGAIITDVRNRILGTGYNGVSSGFTHCTDVSCEGRFDPPGDSSRCWAVHAEINCLINCTRLDLAQTMYVSCSPCFACAKAIVNTSITRVVCLEPYAEQNDVLVKAGIKLFYLGQTVV